ncbi:hypothetical protein ALC56_14126, partial [Trachymyrmex septentrionalis]
EFMEWNTAIITKHLSANIFTNGSSSIQLHVLHKMSNTVVVICLISTARIYPKTNSGCCSSTIFTGNSHSAIQSRNSRSWLIDKCFFQRSSS